MPKPDQRGVSRSSPAAGTTSVLLVRHDEGVAATLADTLGARSIRTQIQQLTRELTAERERSQCRTSELERANIELKRIASAKDDLVSTVSHELRTALTAISEGIHLVADGSLGSINDQQSRFLDLAHRHCSRLAGLVDDVLDLSRIEAGRMEIRPARIELPTLLRETVDTFAPVARERGLNLTAEQTAGDVAAYADETMVCRILANLVSNAVKFTDRGYVRLSAASVGERAVVTVADSGIGIPAAEQPRIFDKFHRAHRHEPGRPGGTGLGLAIARQMVEMNNGRIWFESRQGTGTRFCFTLLLDSTPARLGWLLRSSCPDACSHPRQLALVKVKHDECADPRFACPGSDRVLEAIDRMLGDSQLGEIGRLVVPEGPEILMLFDGSTREPAAVQSRLRGLLSRAASALADKVTAVRTSLAFVNLDSNPDPRALLQRLRSEATYVN